MKIKKTLVLLLMGIVSIQYVMAFSLFGVTIPFTEKPQPRIVQDDLGFEPELLDVDLICREINHNRQARKSLYEFEGDTILIQTEARNVFLTVDQGLLRERGISSYDHKIRTTEQLINRYHNKVTNRDMLSANKVMNEFNVPLKLRLKVYSVIMKNKLSFG